MAHTAVKEIIKSMPSFFRMPHPQAWFDYDKEADVLYIAFDRPQKAVDSEMTPEDIIVRRRGKRIVGLTILHASRFRK